MCGLAGFWDPKATTSRENLHSQVLCMAAAIESRGPDSAGAYEEETSGFALGFRRLAILDLSPLGEQPMRSSSGRYVVAFNGEIYNYREIQQSLIKRGFSFRGHSDTEVMLAAFEAFGVLESCKLFNGMFALALWDTQEKTLFLARDRMGKKPLYWGWQNGVLFFGSQPKSLIAHPRFHPEIDLSSLSSYLRFNYVPTPLSIFKGIQKLQPGTLLRLNAMGDTEEFRFFDLIHLSQCASHESETPDPTLTTALTMVKQSPTEDKAYIKALDLLLRDAVSRRMIADVPLGAFLSGGIDSSTIVALMQAQSSDQVKTFTIGFNEQDFDEAVYAEKVAKHLGTDHHSLIMAPKEAQDVIPHITDWCDEPFADVSQIPTFLVSRLARQQVVVCLSGDGGDELFAGYNRYFLGLRLKKLFSFLPLWLRRTATKGIRSVPPAQWERFSRLLPTRIKPRLMADKMAKLAEVLSTEESQFYRRLVSHWNEPEALLPGIIEPCISPWQAGSDMGHLNFVERMQLMDMLTYLPDDILTKVDRATMAVGLEARVPMLDHRVVEFALKLPMDQKIRHGKGKWLLRQVLKQYVPESLIERPKMGFGVPIDQWLRGPLRDWAESLLQKSSLESSGFNPAPILSRWQAHLSGTSQWHYALWGVLMYQSWRNRFNL